MHVSPYLRYKLSLSSDLFSCPPPALFLRAQVYSEEGYERVKSIEGIKDLLARHFPDIAKQIPKDNSGFKPWGV